MSVPMEEININTTILNVRIINSLKKQTNRINILPTSISSMSFFINLPEFTNLRATLELADFLAIYYSKINSSKWQLQSSSDSEYLILKYSDKNSKIKIERHFKKVDEIENLALNEEPRGSILLPKQLYSFISKLEFEKIKLVVFRDTLKVFCEDLEVFEAIFKNLETQMSNKLKASVVVDLRSLIAACNDFDRQVVCFFDGFIIIYSYYKEIVMAILV
ncbi:hypothetical protein CDIK_0154 [Cucumispora dikerogammari]|nr:hypothetical protein CDIK_0154 [Cucumispora dikerogammari]